MTTPGLCELEELAVITYREQPIAVLVQYEAYMWIQDILIKYEEIVRERQKLMGFRREAK
jgi:hypothetical protein